MEAFSKRFPMASENHTQNPFPQFPGGFPGAFFAENFGSRAYQATHMNSNPFFAAIPIRSVTPTNGPMNYKSKTKPAKSKNTNKPSAKDTTHFKMSRPKQTKKGTSTTKKTKGPVELGRNVERKNPDLVYDEANVDFSRVPPPFCSCTGVARACYKWGSGSWQSSCCNTTMSQYPLPKSPSKPGARINGRKMSSGAYRKLLCRFAAEGRDLSQPVDLKNHWAKLGTNKFVTIK